MRNCKRCKVEFEGKWAYCGKCRKIIRAELSEDGYLEKYPSKTMYSSFTMGKEHKDRHNLSATRFTDAAEGMGNN